MIVQLRTRHRLAMIVVAVVAPLILFAGVILRAPMPVMETIPPLDEDLFVDGAPLFDRDGLWDNLAMTTRLYGDRRYMVLELVPETDPDRPDLLVIWQAGQGGDPADGHVLGSLAGRRACRFLLPAHAAERDGSLTLFSLAHGETVARCELPSVAVYREDGDEARP